MAETADRLARLTHDLRTPVNVVVGFAGLLKEEAGDALSPRARDYLERIIAAGQEIEAALERAEPPAEAG